MNLKAEPSGHGETRVRWTPSAAKDLKEIIRYIRQDNSAAANAVAETLYNQAESLNIFSGRGRVGRISGTRELVVAGLPYIIVYKITDVAVDIVRIYHAARDWPD